MQKGSSASITVEGLKNHEKNSMTEPISQRNGSKDAIRNTTNRRSKSLDDLLDDDQSLLIVEDERETQSMENILEKADSKRASNESIVCSASQNSSEKLCENEVMMVDNSMQVQPESDHEESQNDSGIQCDTPKRQSDTSSFDDDTISNSKSISSSTASEKKSGKTFLNKYVKKVKNLMSRPQQSTLPACTLDFDKRENP
jgi:hypothetical protein